MEQNRGDRESPKSQLKLHPLMPLASTASSTKAPGVGVDVLALAGRVSGVYHAPRICDRLFAFFRFRKKTDRKGVVLAILPEGRSKQFSSAGLFRR